MLFEMRLHLCWGYLHIVGDFIDWVSDIPIGLFIFFFFYIFSVCLFLVHKFQVLLLSFLFSSLLSIDQKDLSVVLYRISRSESLNLLQIVKVSCEVRRLFSSLFKHSFKMRYVIDLVAPFTLQKWSEFFFYFFDDCFPNSFFWLG